MAVIDIPEEYQGKRADIALAELDPTVSRSQWKKRLDQGLISQAGKVLRAKDKLVNDKISYAEPEVSNEVVEFEILFDDEHYQAINKPEGVLTHSPSEHIKEFSVADYAKTISDDPDILRPGIVHRLDRGTSGVILLAKTIKAKSAIQSLFKDRSIRKEYDAIAEGVIKEERFKLSWPIERNPKKPIAFRVGPQGKSAETVVEVQAIEGKQTHIKLLPKTGRTHQLRVHMAHYGHPIVGDEIYGAKAAERLYLHATKLGFKHPFTHKEVEIIVKTPWDTKT